MKVSELRSKNKDQLVSLLEDNKKESMHLRFRASVQSLENPSRIRVVRRTIARIKTILRQMVGGR